MTVASGLLLAVLLDVGLHRLFGMAPGVNAVSGRRVRMVRGSFVFPGRMMFGGFSMVVDRLSKVFRSLLVVLCSFL